MAASALWALRTTSPDFVERPEDSPFILHEGGLAEGEAYFARHVEDWLNIVPAKEV